MRTSPWRECARQLSGQLGLRLPLVRLDAVYQAFDRQVAKQLAGARNVVAVYAYDGGALETFRAARRRGIKCVYEHPIAYWRTVRQLHREEAELHPEWAATLLALRDSEEKLEQKDEELRLADVVIVPSTFSRQSLAHAPDLRASVHVIGYGAPPAKKRTAEVHRGALRVLFVGALSQAKGLGYLFEAVDKLGAQIQLTVIGQRVSATIPTQATLDRHRWIASLSHHEILGEMSRHDVLVFPSLHEGFGLVALEAMAQGAVVIATPNSAAPDLIEDGRDGFIVPIRSSEAIADKLNLLADDCDRLAGMKEAAQRKAELHRWELYRERVVALAREVVAQ
jgi:glycosyltransferase involved in cell wall biosynthesis